MTGVSLDWLYFGQAGGAAGQGGVDADAAAVVWPRVVSSVCLPDGGWQTLHDRGPIACNRARLLEFSTAPEGCVLLAMASGAMVPTICPGDFVLYDPAQTAIQDDTLFVLQVDGQLLVRRVFIRPGLWVLQPDAAGFHPFEWKREEAPLTVAGRVLGNWAEFGW